MDRFCLSSSAPSQGTQHTTPRPAENGIFCGHCWRGCDYATGYAGMISGIAKDMRWLAVISHDAGDAPRRSKPAAQRWFEGAVRPRADRPAAHRSPGAVQRENIPRATHVARRSVLWTHANAIWGAKVNALHEDLQRATGTRPTCRCFHTKRAGLVDVASRWGRLDLA